MNPRRQSLEGLSRDLILGSLPFIIGLELFAAIVFLPLAFKGDADFRPFYTTGYMVRIGHSSEVYDYAAQHRFQNEIVSHTDIALPFIHPAYEALLFVPFSFVPYRAAYVLWMGLNVGLAVLCARLLDVDWLLLAAFVPLFGALVQGQDSIVMLLLFVIASKMRREWRQGVIVGCTAFRFQILIPIALLYLLWRKWGFVAGMAISSLVCAAVSIWLTGWSQSFAYVRLLQELVSASDKFQAHLSAMPNLRGIVLTLHGPMWLVAVLSLTVILWFARKSPGLSPAITCAALVSFHFFPHDMSLLLIPFASTKFKAPIVASACGIFPAYGWLASVATLGIAVQESTVPV